MKKSLCVFAVCLILSCAPGHKADDKPMEETDDVQSLHPTDVFAKELSRTNQTLGPAVKPGPGDDYQYPAFS